MNYLHSTLYNLRKNSFNENDFLIAHDFFKRSDYENSKEMQQKCLDELEHIENIKDTFTKIYLKYDLHSNNTKHSQETELYIKKQKDLNKKYPCCIDGQNHAPFEDIGGIFGYLDILDALQDPKHPRYDDYMQIIEDEIGEIEFDPTYFNSHDIKF